MQRNRQNRSRSLPLPLGTGFPALLRLPGRWGTGLALVATSAMLVVALRMKGKG